VLHKEIETYHSKKHQEGIGASILRQADVVGHKTQRESAGKSDGNRKLSCKQVNHGDGKGSEDQWDDPEVSFGLGKGIELMGQNKEKGRMKIRRVLLIKFYLPSKIISRVIEGVDFIYPERFLVKCVKPQGKT
jgi:hypothetical protein